MSSASGTSEVIAQLLEAQKSIARSEEEFLELQARKLYEGLSRVHSFYLKRESRLAVWLHDVGQSGYATQVLRTDEVLAVINETARLVRNNGTNRLIGSLNKLFNDLGLGVESDYSMTKFTLSFHPDSTH